MVVGMEAVGTEAAYTMKFSKVSKNRQCSAFFESNNHCTRLDCRRVIIFCHSFVPCCVLSDADHSQFPTQITLNLGLLPVLLFRLFSRLFSRFRSHSRLNLGWRRNSRQAHGILGRPMGMEECDAHSSIFVPFQIAPPVAMGGKRKKIASSSDDERNQSGIPNEDDEDDKPLLRSPEKRKLRRWSVP